MLDHIHHGWWAMTTEGVFYVETSGQLLRDRHPINLLRFRSGRVEPVGVIEGDIYPDRPDFCVSADGARILYGIGRFAEAEIRIAFDPW